jgi:AraC-like DNA-binding protein
MIGSYLFTTLEELGLDQKELFRAATIPQDVFTQAEPAISDAAYIKLWSALRAATDRPDLCVVLGRAAGLSLTSKIHLITYGSATTQEYLQQIKRFGPLIAAPLSSLSFAKGRLDFRPSVDGQDAAVTLHIMAQMVALIASIRQATGTHVMPARVMVRQAADIHNASLQAATVQALAAYFDCEVETADMDFIEFDAAACQLPFRLTCGFLWSCVSDGLDAQLWQVLKNMPAHKLVEQALETLLPQGNANIECVATALAIGERTLQRHLRNENTDFRSVLEMTRRKLARKYILTAGITQRDIAKKLGFQDANSFYRLWRSWRQ